MFSIRRRALALLAVPAVAVAVLAMPSAVQASPNAGPTQSPPSGNFAKGTPKPGAPSATPSGAASPSFVASYGPLYICADGGAGLCLQDNGNLNTLVANDNKVGGAPAKQLWQLNEIGTTTNTWPFALGSGLNTQVANGRKVYQVDDWWTPQLCMWPTAGDGTALITTCNMNNTADRWVASGSGALINVDVSNTSGNLAFLKSSGANGGNPQYTSTHTCPGACWSDVDH